MKDVYTTIELQTYLETRMELSPRKSKSESIKNARFLVKVKLRIPTCPSYVDTNKGRSLENLEYPYQDQYELVQ